VTIPDRNLVLLYSETTEAYSRDFDDKEYAEWKKELGDLEYIKVWEAVQSWRKRVGGMPSALELRALAGY
jgi:hypothetical protein